MKKFCFGMLACGAMLAPAFAEDEAAPPVDETVVDLAVTSELVVEDVTDVQTLEVTTLEVSQVCEHEHGEECIDRCLADDSQIVTFGVEEEGNIADDRVYLMSTTGIQENQRNLTSESVGLTTGLSLGVNQLADEQRNSLRLFSGRDGQDNKAGLKGLFARTDVKTSTTITVADKQLAKKKAEIDQMRDKALKTGDVKLLARADAQAAKLNGAKVKQKSLFSFGAKK
jgi:hypothetical protein